MTNTNIEWRPIPTVEDYEVSSNGLIRRSEPGKSTHVGRLLRQRLDDSGYLYVQIRRKRVRVHRAVLFAFVGRPPEGDWETRHLDGDKSNNRVDNLVWGTDLEQASDKQRHGTQPRGERSVSAKLTEEQVRQIRADIGTVSLRQLAANYGVSHTAIRRAANGTKWSHVR